MKQDDIKIVEINLNCFSPIFVLVITILAAIYDQITEF